MKPVRFAIVGCGAISQAHIHAIAHTEGAALAATVDIAEERARQAAQEAGCAWYTSIDKMLEQADVDAIAVCTASGLHLEPSLAAAAAGKHLLIEKPLEVTPERCDAIIDSCKRHGVLLSGVFQSRFLPANQLVKESATAGAFGKLILGNAEVKWFRAKEYYEGAKWRGTWRYDGGGALMNQGIHQVDLLQWIMGPVVSVQAVTRRLVHESIEVEDLAVALLQFADSSVGVLEASTGISPGYPKRLEVHGSQGGAIIQDDVLLSAAGIPASAKLEAAKLPHGNTANYASPMAMSFLGHECQYADLVRVIRTGGSPAISGEEARRAVEIVTAVYESARNDSVVSLTPNAASA